MQFYSGVSKKNMWPCGVCDFKCVVNETRFSFMYLFLLELLQKCGTPCLLFYMYFSFHSQDSIPWICLKILYYFVFMHAHKASNFSQGILVHCRFTIHCALQIHTIHYALASVKALITCDAGGMPRGVCGCGMKEYHSHIYVLSIHAMHLVTYVAFFHPILYLSNLHIESLSYICLTPILKMQPQQCALCLLNLALTYIYGNELLKDGFFSISLWAFQCKIHFFY